VGYRVPNTPSDPPATQAVALAIENATLPRDVKNGFWFNLFLIVTVLFALFSIVFLKSYTAAYFVVAPVLFVYTIFVTSFQLSRVIGAIFFRHSLSTIHGDGSHTTYEPTITFVIPCKNEGPAIRKTVTKCFEADYPQEKLEVIVINDGSTDNTLEVLKSLKPLYSNLVVVDWQVNQGKRHGMVEGFRRAKGDIIVQLDSDSYIEPRTFRELITPFANPKIGAVCAHADPENSDTNLITRMQAAYYFVSFRILKAAESTFMTVFCCSGCSSAYRKSLVLPILDTWLAEKFLGLPVTWGDDRALTNWVLKLNHMTIYSDNVQAYTICPDNLKTFLKQQVRWKKGWFVNSFFASKWVFKKHPFVAITYFFPLILLTLLTPFMAFRALVWGPIIDHSIPVYYVGTPTPHFER